MNKFLGSWTWITKSEHGFRQTFINGVRFVCWAYDQIWYNVSESIRIGPGPTDINFTNLGVCSSVKLMSLPCFTANLWKKCITLWNGSDERKSLIRSHPESDWISSYIHIQYFIWSIHPDSHRRYKFYCSLNFIITNWPRAAAEL